MTTSSFPEDLPKPEARAEAGSAAAGAPDRLLEHEYDGIREYDNPLPRWWVLVFWGSFVFSLGYLFHYHFSGRGGSLLASYEGEMSEAREQRAKRVLGDTVNEEGLLKVMQDPELLADAKVLFAARCASCHADRGQGLIGPNLTDAYWIHGSGTLMDAYKIVSQGVPEKGMPAWESQLTPIELRKLAALVGSLRGQNLPGRPAQGNLVAAH